MVSFKLLAIALTALRACNVLADIELPEGFEVEELQEIPEDIDGSSDVARLAIAANVSFPDAEIFGVKMVNGRPTRSLITITNNEAEAVTALIAMGSLYTPFNVPGAPDPPQILRNLTAQRYGVQIPPKAQETITYSFATVMHAQDLALNLRILVQKGDAIYTQTVFHETVSIVEAPISILDPQIIFLYLVLAAAFIGTCYFIYTTWITTLFPQKKRGGKGGERAKKSSGGSKVVDPSDQAAVVGGDGPAVTSGANAYDASWIPAGHLNQPQSRRIGGRTKSRGP